MRGKRCSVGRRPSRSPRQACFRLPRWRRDLEECWSKLEAGDYDWSRMAFTLWPDRVREKCKKDRSLAIAHGLEELCETAAPKPARKRKTTAEETSLFGESGDG